MAVPTRAPRAATEENILKDSQRVDARSTCGQLKTSDWKRSENANEKQGDNGKPTCALGTAALYIMVRKVKLGMAF